MLTRRGFCSLPLTAAATPSRPNILFIVTDDQTFRSLHGLNHAEIRTPHLDRLMARGTTFTRAHIMGGTISAICCPSRGMFLSGQSLFRAHETLVRPLIDRKTQAPEPPMLFPEMLRRAGYATFFSGKWNSPAVCLNRGFKAGGPVNWNQGGKDQFHIPYEPFSPEGRYARERQRLSERHSAEVFTDPAVGFLRGYRETRPFHLHVSYLSPHDPRTAPPEYHAMYPPERIQLPPSFLPQHPFETGDMRGRDERLAPWPRTPEVIRRHLSDYYASITHVDAQIGRILTALDETGHTERTVVIVTSDNGLAVGRHGLMGKQNLYDHSVRVPLIFAGPGVGRDRRADTLCYLMDLYPTICDLAGLPVPPTVEGRSLAPALRHPHARIRDSVFYAYRHLQRGVRKGDWKLVEFHVDGIRHTQLFDLRGDPEELNNLAGLPRQAGRIRELRVLLKRWMRECGDPVEFDAPVWKSVA